jgi:hypothetical protein
MDTHGLESTEGDTSQDSERMRATWGTHSLESVEGETTKGSERAWGTHFLDSAEGMTSERKRESEGHSRTGEWKG